MVKEECNQCPFKELNNFRAAMEKRLFKRMPPEVREPLQEAKYQLLLAVQGFIQYNLREESALRDHVAKSRHIRFE